MNVNIPTPYYLSLKKQQPLNELLENIFAQIELIKRNKFFNSENIKFELEFRLRNKYLNVNLKEYINKHSFSYLEYLFKDNQSTKYRIICDYQYVSNKNTVSNKNVENNIINNENMN